MYKAAHGVEREKKDLLQKIFVLIFRGSFKL